MNLTDLKKKSISELVELAQSMNIENPGRFRKQEIIFSILKAHTKKDQQS